jgi:gliding motility-associated-like protein
MNARLHHTMIPVLILYLGAIFNLGNGMTLHAQDGQRTLRVIAIEQVTGIQSVSNQVVVSDPFLVYIPSAFSPNGDGINDFFEVHGQQIRAFQMTVFDRTGTPIFNSSDPSYGWDGSYQGQPVPLGMYSYIITAENEVQGNVNRTGTVMLLR